jgi:hypothetical protein
MTKEERTDSFQRLPTEIIVDVFKYASEKRAWQLSTLTRINRPLRSSFLPRLSEQLHLHSPKQMNSLILQGWPSHDRKSVPPKLALYLHYLHHLESEDDFYEELLDQIEDLPKPTRERIGTLGIRTLPSNKAIFRWGSGRRISCII